VTLALGFMLELAGLALELAAELIQLAAPLRRAVANGLAHFFLDLALDLAALALDPILHDAPPFARTGEQEPCPLIGRHEPGRSAGCRGPVAFR